MKRVKDKKTPVSIAVRLSTMKKIEQYADRHKCPISEVYEKGALLFIGEKQQESEVA